MDTGQREREADRDFPPSVNYAYSRIGVQAVRTKTTHLYAYRSFFLAQSHADRSRQAVVWARLVVHARYGERLFQLLQQLSGRTIALL
jgi:hypothetical protein